MISPPPPKPKVIPKVVGITGHRDLIPGDLAKIRAAMKALLANVSVDEIWFGGATGVDTEALRAALEFRVGRRPKLVVILPDTLLRQPYQTHSVTRQADSIIELKRAITPDDGYRAFHERNEFIVNHASVLVAFWSGVGKSGTASTVTYAKKTKLPVKIIPIGK